MPPKGNRYRMESSTIALFEEDGRQVARMTPQGEVIVVEEEVLTQNGLVRVWLREKPVMMFTQDIRRRGQKVD